MISIPISTQADLLSALVFIKDYYGISGSPTDIFLIIKNFQCIKCPDGKVIEVCLDKKDEQNPKVCFKILPPTFLRGYHFLYAKVDKTFFRGLRDFEYQK